MSVDKIFISDLSARGIIGINEEERKKKQDVLVNLVLYVNLSASCNTDDINDTVDYKAIKNNVLNLIENSSFFLLEKLAESIAKIALFDKRVLRVTVKVEKPGALRFAKSVGVEIDRA